MGDRSSLQVTVYDVSAAEAAIVVGSLDNLMMDFVPDGPDLALGEAYVDGQTSIDVPSRLAVHLAEHAPGATFTVVGGSYCPYPAEIHLHVPGLGLYSCEASESGEPTFAASEVQGWITEWAARAARGAATGSSEVERLRELVHVRTGGLFRDHIDAMIEGLEEGTLPRRVRAVWPCLGCGRAVREQDPGTTFETWIHVENTSHMRACADGTGVAAPDRAAVPVFCG